MRWLAAAVHLFTASGAVCALMAVVAIHRHDAEAVFIWLGIAFIIDGIDGTFARAVRVSEQLPRFSGDRLDIVVDYLTYVFVPVLALLEWGQLSGSPGFVLSALILLSSLYHFADLASKSKDNSFVGFPAIWNIVAFYVFACGLSHTVTALIVLCCVAATFIPTPWVHPFRVEWLRGVSLAATATFAIASILAVRGGFPAAAPVQIVLAAVAAYGAGLSVYSFVVKQLASED
jgi:phosphatidylcholine synthase